MMKKGCQKEEEAEGGGMVEKVLERMLEKVLERMLEKVLERMVGENAGGNDWRSTREECWRE